MAVFTFRRNNVRESQIETDTVHWDIRHWSLSIEYRLSDIGDMSWQTSQTDGPGCARGLHRAGKCGARQLRQCFSETMSQWDIETFRFWTIHVSFDSLFIKKVLNMFQFWICFSFEYVSVLNMFQFCKIHLFRFCTTKVHYKISVWRQCAQMGSAAPDSKL